MSIGDIKPIPSGFLARLLREFGVEWTHVVIVSGAVLSSFGLERYLDPGIWILGTVASFALVYLFRLQITGNFPVVAAWAGGAMLLGVAAPLAILLAKQWDVAGFVRNWSEAATLYLSGVIGIPLGTAILSYRSQDEFQRSPLPPELEKAAQESVSKSDFVHESANYEIRFMLRDDGAVTMRFDVTMAVLNRLNRPATYRDIFDPAGRQKKFHHASVAGHQVNAGDPERLSQRGLLLSHDAGANERFVVAVSAESTFYGRDSELVGVYFPCASFSVLIRTPPAGLAVHVQSLLRRKVDPKLLPSGDMLIEYADGVLPFQGVRLYWETAGDGIVAHAAV